MTITSFPFKRRLSLATLFAACVFGVFTDSVVRASVQPGIVTPRTKGVNPRTKGADRVKQVPADRLDKVAIDSTIDPSDSVIAESAHARTIGSGKQLELGASYDNLSNGFAPWNSIYLEGAYPFGVRKTFYAKAEYINEFSISDGDVFAGVYYPLLPSLTAVVEGEVGFKHIITPVWSLFGQLEYKIIPGLLIEGGLRNSEYRDAAGTNNEVQLFNIGAEYWFSYYRLVYTFYESRGNGGIWNPPSHLVEFGYYYGDANSISIGASIGHEVARISQNGAPVDLRAYGTKSIFLLGRHWLTTDWGLSYELGWHQMDQSQNSSTTLYDRYGIRLGIRHRF